MFIFLHSKYARKNGLFLGNRQKTFLTPCFLGFKK